MNSFNHDIPRCRLCGKEEKNIKFRDIFEENQKLGLEEKIAKLLPIVVMPEDPLPHKVCLPCVKKINLFNEFYDGSLKAEELLRTYFPTAPTIEIESEKAIVQISNTPEIQKLLKLPPNSIQKQPEINKEKIISVNNTVQVPDESTKEKLKSFIINPISSTASVFTCRKCFRTYTKESSALSHSCISLEECEKLREMSSKKSLPPLKIRLFYIASNKYVCRLCQKSCSKKRDMSKHVKTHLLYNRTKCKENLDKKDNKKKKKVEEKKKKIVNGLKGVRTVEENSNENTLRFNSSNQNIPNKKTESPKKICSTAEDKQEIENQEPQKISTNTKNYKNFNFKNLTPTKVNDLNSQEIYIINDDDDDDELYQCFCCVFCDKMYSSKEILLNHQQSHLHNSKTFTQHTMREKKIYHKNINKKEENYNCKSCGIIMKNKNDHNCQFKDFIDLG